MGDPAPREIARLTALAKALPGLRLVYDDLEAAAELLRRSFLSAPSLRLWGSLLKKLKPFAEKG